MTTFAATALAGAQGEFARVMVQPERTRAFAINAYSIEARIFMKAFGVSATRPGRFRQLEGSDALEVRLERRRV